MDYTTIRLSVKDFDKIKVYAEQETEIRGSHVSKTLALHEIIDKFFSDKNAVNKSDFEFTGGE